MKDSAINSQEKLPIKETVEQFVILMLYRPQKLSLLGITLVLAMWASACEESVDPFVESDKYYTVYGFLDSGVAKQQIRVVPLRRSLLREDAQTIDARVTTTALENGSTVVWEDSLITFADGSIGHVFQGDFRPAPGWTYELKIERSDGQTSTAVTTLPEPVRARIDAPDISIGGTNTTQQITWEGLDYNPYRVEVWYRFINTPATAPFIDAVVTYDETEIGRRDDEGWLVSVQLTNDKIRVAESLGVDEDTGLTLMGVGMRLTMADDSWRPPGGVFDPEILVQPGTFSNVENGFGFFGSVNQYTVEWTLDPVITEILGYAFPGEAQQ